MSKLSELINYPRLKRTLDRFGLGRSIEPSDDLMDGIVSHSDEPPSPRPATLGRWVSMSARVGFLGITATLIWWTWPKPLETDLPPALLMTEQEKNSTQAGIHSLAIINPANLQQPHSSNSQPANPQPLAMPTFLPPTEQAATQAVPDATQQAAWFESITVVTSTIATSAPLPGVVAPEPEAVANSGEQASGVAIADGDMPADLSGNDYGLEETGVELQAGATQPTPVMIALEIPPAAKSMDNKVLPAVVSQPLPTATSPLQPEIVLIPTATPMPTPVVEQVANVPKVQVVPAIGLKATATPIPTATPEPSPTATAVPSITGPGRLWATFVPQPAAEIDHFWIGNPFADVGYNKQASPSYQFGSTGGNRYRPHHGLDISNPVGTPVQAAVAGTVVHAGLDDPELLGPYNNFYGNAVVIRLDRRLPVAGGEMDVYLLYGHLNETHVTVGQHVEPKDIIGVVGMTGIAIGPHLHVEIRLGSNTYQHSVNPYLWMQPEDGTGAVAVRILTADGRTWAGARVSIARFEGGRSTWGRQIETYLDTENIGPDPVWGENGAMGSVPAGYYLLVGNVNGENLRAEFTVRAGETTFVELRTQQ